LTSSVTDEGDRGTPKYFAPEVASFAPSGRSADIFSLGCIFFELWPLYNGYGLFFTQRLRRFHDKSFQSNLDQIVGWFKENTARGSTAVDDYLLGLVRWMMEEEAALRPTADVVEDEVFLINGLGLALHLKHGRHNKSGFYRPCCWPEERSDRKMGLSPIINPVFTIKVKYGRRNVVSSDGPGRIVYLEHTGVGLVESVHIFTVSTPVRLRARECAETQSRRTDPIENPISFSTLRPTNYSAEVGTASVRISSFGQATSGLVQ